MPGSDVPPSSSLPSNVIALSRYRAELGRGRRLRRADALLESRDLRAAVRALPGDELYYVIHEVGLRDAGDILAEATPEQLQVVLDFAIWERDQVEPEALADWAEAMAAAPIDRIGAWMEGLDSELVGLLLRRGARIYDLTLEGPPDEPEGTFFPTPDGFFLLDVVGLRHHRDDESGDAAAAPAPLAPDGDDEEETSARVLVRLVDAFYRTDKDLARRMLVGARSEMDAELEESALRWRHGRMADLGFADYYDALEVYRELDPATVQLRDEAATPRARRGSPRPAAAEAGHGADTALRVPTALAERLADTGGSPFARAAHQLAGEDLDQLRAALVALTNMVLAADRVTPGDDTAVGAVLERMSATLDVAVERLAAGDDARGAEALRSIPLIRLFRLGVSVVGKVRRLAMALRRRGPLGPGGAALAEPEDAAVLDAVTRLRPLFPRLLDDQPAAGERPFQSLSDVARATAAIERAAAAQVLLRGLGVTAEDLAPDAPALEAAGVDVAALDAGLLARTVLIHLLASSPPPKPPIPLRALDPTDVQAFEAGLESTPDSPMKLPNAVKKKAKAILDALAPSSLAGAASAVADRWIAGLAPLEPVLVRKPPTKPRRR
jgi:hypothetical protein